jgi:hypothetical protein
VATDVLHQTVNGERRAIGTLWAVRLRPGKARLTLDDYIYPWRNLAVDMANGVLSYNWVKAYEETRDPPHPGRAGPLGSGETCPPQHQNGSR